MGRDQQVSINAERLYRKLFKTPEEKKLLPSFLFLLLLSSLFEPSAILFTALILLTIFASKMLLGLKFNLRRTLFLTILVLLLGLISTRISGSFSGAYFLFLAVLYFCSEKDLFSISLVSSIPFLVVEPSSAPFVALSALLFFLYLQLLKSGVDIDLNNYVRGFVRFWLTEDPRYLESVLARDSEEFEGRVRCLRIGNARIISTDFHPGPFRDLGGAKLVEALDFPDSIYLHSPSSHERDPVSEEDVVAIRSAVECGTQKLSAMKAFEIEGEKFKVYCFPFDKIKLIFVSGKHRIDDFVVQSRNFVVDCHNANFFGSLSAEEIEEIRELVRRAEGIEGERATVKSGFVKIEFSSESVVRYVSAILLDYGSERFAIVVFDSNNVDLDFRREVELKFSQLGYKAIVCSTDNHRKTGVKVRESYKPAGSCSEDREALERLIEKCRSTALAEATFFYGERKVRVRVLGSILEKLGKVEKRVERYIALFFFLVFLCLLLPFARVI